MRSGKLLRGSFPIGEARRMVLDDGTACRGNSPIEN